MSRDAIEQRITTNINRATIYRVLEPVQKLLAGLRKRLFRSLFCKFRSV
jgi:hypothetical protein